jgi:hypothetical protein
MTEITEEQLLAAKREREAPLRDQFAMAALTGILAHGDATISTTESICYKIADAMLEARDK